MGGSNHSLPLPMNPRLPLTAQGAAPLNPVPMAVSAASYNLRESAVKPLNVFWF